MRYEAGHPAAFLALMQAYIREYFKNPQEHL